MNPVSNTPSRPRSQWDKDALWYYEATLTCGHKVVFGVVPLHVLEGLVPRRKDGSFGALRCSHGRRRVVMTHSANQPPAEFITQNGGAL